MYILYILKKKHIKFHADQMLFTFRSINLFFMYNFRLQKLKILTFDYGIVINLWSFWNFANMENIRRKCNSKVDLSKFTSNKKYVKWSCSLSVQPILLQYFVQTLIMLGLKEFRAITNFFKEKKIIIFLKIYI